MKTLFIPETAHGSANSAHKQPGSTPLQRKGAYLFTLRFPQSNTAKKTQVKNEGGKVGALSAADLLREDMKPEIRRSLRACARIAGSVISYPQELGR